MAAAVLHHCVGFAVGESPFRTKGNNYRGSVAQYDALVPGGYKAVIASITEPALRGFVSREFFSSEWYDVYPLYALDAHAAALSGLTLDAFVRKTGALQATTDMNGIYRTVLRFISPETALKRLAPFASQLFTFGENQAVNVPNGGSITTRGVPLDLCDWYCRLAAYYLGQVITHAGALNPRYRFEPPTAAGEAHGVTLGAQRWHVEWDRK